MGVPFPFHPPQPPSGRQKVGDPNKGSSSLDFLDLFPNPGARIRNSPAVKTLRFSVFSADAHGSRPDDPRGAVEVRAVTHSLTLVADPGDRSIGTPGNFITEAKPPFQQFRAGIAWTFIGMVSGANLASQYLSKREHDSAITECSFHTFTFASR